VSNEALHARLKEGKGEKKGEKTSNGHFSPFLEKRKGGGSGLATSVHQRKRKERREKQDQPIVSRTPRS